MPLTSCCWEPNFDQEFVQDVHWTDTGGWYNFLDPGTRDIFSGKQTFLAGDIANRAVQRLTDALVQFSRFRKPHHTGENEFLHYLFSDTTEDFGGVAPVAVFVVPDFYMDYGTPTWNLKFQFQHAIRFQGDLNTTIPEQLKASPYYQQFLDQRASGFPGIPQDVIPQDVSVSEQDIDIQFTYVHYAGLEMHGGRVKSVAHFLSNFGGLLKVDVGAEIPPRSFTNMAGVEQMVIPVVFMKTADYLADEAAGFSDPVTYRAMNNAGPAPGSSDMSIQDGFNRIYPGRFDDGEVYLRVNEVLAEIDFTDNVTLAQIYHLLHYLPVQAWSAPNVFQEVVDA